MSADGQMAKLAGLATAACRQLDAARALWVSHQVKPNGQLRAPGCVCLGCNIAREMGWMDEALAQHPSDAEPYNALPKSAHWPSDLARASLVRKGARLDAPDVPGHANWCLDHSDQDSDGVCGYCGHTDAPAEPELGSDTARQN